MATPGNDLIRTFKMTDGRPITIDKFILAFICPDKTDPAGTTVIAFKTNAKPVPVKCAYSEVLEWWTFRPARAADAPKRFARASS